MIKHILLLGMMGSGKTILGQQLAKKLSIRHIDLDDYIAKENHLSFQDFFNLHTIENFRLLESKYLETLIHQLTKTSVISLGGGTLTHSNSLEKYLHHHTIYLQCSLETLFGRLQNSHAQKQRPLLQGLQPEQLKLKLQKILEMREILYQQANYVINNDRDDAQLAIQNIMKVLCLT